MEPPGLCRPPDNQASLTAQKAGELLALRRLEGPGDGTEQGAPGGHSVCAGSMGPQTGLRGEAWRQDCLSHAKLTAWSLQVATPTAPSYPRLCSSALNSDFSGVVSLLTSKDPKQLGSEGAPGFSFPRFARRDLALCGFRSNSSLSIGTSLGESVSRGRTLVVLGF